MIKTHYTIALLGQWEFAKNVRNQLGRYKNVKKGEFCGPSGGAPSGSYPVNSKKRARAALAYARNAPNPGGIKKCVYRKFPEFKKGKKYSSSSIFELILQNNTF